MSSRARSARPTRPPNRRSRPSAARVARLKERLAEARTPEARWLLSLADYLVAKSVWGVGGDGWAYDIGYGGLDQVLASGENINLLVLDTEVYSNTGGQMSKATPLAATAQFAAGGKRTPKKNLAYIMATYGTVYVAQVAFAANQLQTRAGARGGRGLPGPFPRRRVRPLHLPRLRSVARPRGDEAGRRLRALAPLPLQPGPRERGEEPAGHRQQAPLDQLRRVRTSARTATAPCAPRTRRWPRS